MSEKSIETTITWNVAIGIAAMFLLTVAMTLPAGVGIGAACGVAVLPAVFAGPFVGGLVTMVHYVRLGDLG